jgi:hypothetical protein
MVGADSGSHELIVTVCVGINYIYIYIFILGKDEFMC